MKSRGYEAPLIDFDDNQRILLIKALNKPIIQATDFINDIRMPLTTYKYTTVDCMNDPPPTSTQINDRMARVKEAADTIHSILSTCDAYREHDRFIVAISWTLMSINEARQNTSSLSGKTNSYTTRNNEEVYESRAESLIDQVVNDMAILREAFNIHIELATHDPRGRPYNWREVHLMQDIAELYKIHFGKFPPAQSRSRFHKFVVLALGYVGFPQQSWHRAIERAIKNLKSPPSD